MTPQKLWETVLQNFRLFFKYRDISKDIQQIGEAILESLVKLGAIHTEYSKLRVISSVDNYSLWIRNSQK